MEMLSRWLKKWWVGILIPLLSIPAILPLLNTMYFSMHDDQHIVRLFEISKAVLQGNLYPRWVDGLGFGFGYPLLNFYPPLTYYIALPFHLLGLSLVTSIKIMLVLSTLIGGFGVFRVVWEQAKHKMLGIFGAVLFMYFPYRAITLYVRGAFAEFLAASLLPWFAYYFLALVKKPSVRSSIPLGIVAALIMLAHPLVGVPLTLLMVPVAAGTLLFSKKGMKILLHLVIGGLVGVGLSAFFLLPLIFERSATIVDQVNLTNLGKYDVHFVVPYQFWYSPWGYGGSVAGTGDGLSFQFGKVYWLLLGVSALIFGISWVIRERKSALSESEGWGLLGGISVLSLGVVGMMTAYSKPVWDGLPMIHYIQYPWRFFAFLTTLFPLLIAFCISLAQRRLDKRVFTVGVLACAGLVIFAQYDSFRPQRYLSGDDEQYIDSNEIWRVSMTSHEFLPKGVALTKDPKYGMTRLDIGRYDGSYYGTEFEMDPNKYDVGIRQISRTTMNRKFFVNRGEESDIVFTTYNFPGWHAYIDSKRVPITDDHILKFITVTVPAGKHTVELRFEDTPIRRVGDWVSMGTIGILGGLGILGARKKTKA